MKLPNYCKFIQLKISSPFRTASNIVITSSTPLHDIEQQLYGQDLVIQALSDSKTNQTVPKSVHQPRQPKMVRKEEKPKPHKAKGQPKFAVKLQKATIKSEYSLNSNEPGWKCTFKARGNQMIGAKCQAWIDVSNMYNSNKGAGTVVDIQTSSKLFANSLMLQNGICTTRQHRLLVTNLTSRPVYLRNFDTIAYGYRCKSALTFQVETQSDQPIVEFDKQEKFDSAYGETPLTTEQEVNREFEQYVSEIWSTICSTHLFESCKDGSNISILINLFWAKSNRILSCGYFL